MEMLNQIKARTQNEEIKNWIDGPLKAYIQKHSLGIDEQGHLEHIIDYLESRPKPLRLKKMSVKDAIRLAEQWTKRLEKRGQDIREESGDTEVIQRFKNGFTIVKLVGKNAFLREGKLMRHCVGSYVDKPGVIIYSLRDPLNNPHATFEVISENKQITQVKGKGNGPIHPDYIDMVVKFLKKIGMNIRESEMTNLGYIKIDSDFKVEIEKIYGKKHFSWFKLHDAFFLNQEEVERLG